MTSKRSGSVKLPSLLVGVALLGVACTAGGGSATTGTVGGSATTGTVGGSATTGTVAGSATSAPGALPTAAASERVDLEEPSFGDPTNVVNPLFPISDLHSALLLGTEEGEPLRVEVTLLPEPRVIEWNGQQVETLESQYTAFIDRRILEIALDWYAQADDGSVWYFGEDVFNYEDGVVADTEGTWMAGRDGPAAMIMPADPQVGDVYRPENIPGLVFEEVTVISVGETVEGPRGPVDGAVVVEELHMEGTLEEKTFAPGYGEFSTGSGANLEALALAVPTDGVEGAVPAELTELTTGVSAILGSTDWNSTAAELEAMTASWDSYAVRGAPPMLEAQMGDALDALTEATDARNRADTRHAAIGVGLAALDLQLQYRPPAEIDQARFAQWTEQLTVDAAAGDPAAVHGDVATLEWIRDRFAHTISPSQLDDIDGVLENLRVAADEEDLAAVTDGAAALRDLLAAAG